MWRQLYAAATHAEHGWKSTHFWGPVANWALVGSAVWDGANYGPEVISTNMTVTMCIYSAVFMRFSWMVQPRNYLLLSCHIFNEIAQLRQLYRAVKYKQEQGEKAFEFTQDDYVKGGAAAAGGLALIAASPKIQRAVARAGGRAERFAMHPAGPFTVMFWAPAAKWLLSGSNLMDYDRPVENISTSQQLALAATGFIWSRYSLVIYPVNYSLFVVNFALACTATFQLARKFGLSPPPALD